MFYVIKSKIIADSQSLLAIVIGPIIGVLLCGVIKYFIDRKRASTTGKRISREIGKLFNSYDNLAILGQPGAGKSTYIQFIALTLAQAKAGEKRLRKVGVVKKRFACRLWYLPILIPLRKVSTFLRESNIDINSNLFFEAFRKHVLPSEIRNTFSDSYVRFMLRKKRVIFLLDGLDEVANNEEFGIVVREIKGP